MSKASPPFSRTEFPVELPIDQALPRVPELLATGKGCLLVKASTGSGKTTRIPPYLADWLSQTRPQQSPSQAQAREPSRHKTPLVIVLQPRRLAAKLAAERVAREQNHEQNRPGESVGGRIGYRFRFENKSSNRTEVIYVTEALLLKMMIQNPNLEGTRAVVLDEFHERHLSTDTALALLWRLKKSQRPDLHLIVMSATLDTAELESFIATQQGSPPAILEVPGRTFPLTIESLKTQGTPFSTEELKSQRELSQALLLAVKQGWSRWTHLSKDGAFQILAFLPGSREIQWARTALNSWAQEHGVDLLSLSASLDPQEQKRVLSPPNGPRITLCTNIAESAVTLPLVVGVIDSGLVREASQFPGLNVTHLKTKPTSKASCLQRAGRAGRNGPGLVIQLFSKHDGDHRPFFDVPEILRADLTELELDFRAMGTSLNQDIPWFTNPRKVQIDAAMAALNTIGCDHPKTNPRWPPLLAASPLGPLHGCFYVLLRQEGCSVEQALAAALWLHEDPTSQERSSAVEDLWDDKTWSSLPQISAKRDPRLWQMSLTWAQGSDTGLLETCPFPKPLPRGAVVATLGLKPLWHRALLGAFASQLAQINKDGDGTTVSGALCRFPSSSRDTLKRQGLSHGLVLNGFLLDQQNQERFSVGRWHALSADEALEHPFLNLKVHYEVDWLEEGEVWLVRENWRIGLVSVMDETQRISPTRLDSWLPSAAPEIQELFKTAIRKRDARHLDSDPHWQTLLLRMDLLRRKRPDLLAPPWNEVSPDHPDALDPALHALLEKATPRELILPHGRRVEIHYEKDKDPWVESRLQDFFGMTKTPHIAQQSIPLTIHLLAPNLRPIQVTKDLEGFWKRVYQELRTQLSRRYPRHPWPENPETATPPPPKKPR